MQNFSKRNQIYAVELLLENAFSFEPNFLIYVYG